MVRFAIHAPPMPRLNSIKGARQQDEAAIAPNMLPITVSRAVTLGGVVGARWEWALRMCVAAFSIEAAMLRSVAARESRILYAIASIPRRRCKVRHDRRGSSGARTQERRY